MWIKNGLITGGYLTSFIHGKTEIASRNFQDKVVRKRHSQPPLYTQYNFYKKI